MPSGPLAALGWEKSVPGSIPLRVSEVHLWAWTLEVADSRLEFVQSMLAKDERLRMDRFHFERDRLAYLAGRATLRRILGGYLSLEPKAVRFVYSEHGKPNLAPEQGGLEFNLSHTKARAVAAVSWNLPLGVDIEDKRPIALHVAKDLFSTDEHDTLRELAAEARVDGFYNCWTRKEAIAKAEGLGLSLPLAEFSVSLRPGATPCVIKTGGVLSRGWRLFQLPMGEQTAGTLAVSEHPERLRLFCL